MKKYFLITLLALGLMSCECDSSCKNSNNDRNYLIKELDGHDFIVYRKNAAFFVHSPNCRTCKK